MLASVLGACVLAIAMPVGAADISRQDREKAEVRAIFAMLLSRLKPGDGLIYDLPCVVSEQWKDFTREDGTTIRPNVLLSPREALDPKGEHPDMFCNFEARDAKAKGMAKDLPGDDRARITTADNGF